MQPRSSCLPPGPGRERSPPVPGSRGCCRTRRAPGPPATPWPPPAPPERPLVPSGRSRPPPLCAAALAPGKPPGKAPAFWMWVPEEPGHGPAVPTHRGNGRSLGQLCSLQIPSCGGSGALPCFQTMREGDSSEKHGGHPKSGVKRFIQY